MDIAEVETLLIIAADKSEFDGIRRCVSGLRPLQWPVAFAAMGDWQERPIALVSNGPGPRLASAAFTAALERTQVSSVVSTGFCGGLDPALHVGDIVLGNEIDAPESGQRWPVAAPRFQKPAAAGRILSVDRVAVSVGEKRRLHAGGAAAVEMEAAGMAGTASERGIPFYCVRVVSDAATDAMPLDFNLHRTADGEFNRSSILRAALSRPFSRIPALLQLQRHCKFASFKLGEFFADCRF